MNDRIDSATALPPSVCELTELVRGKERILLEHFLPLVRRQTITLNLKKVTRIDAAGLAALIALYRAAREAGHTFAVSNPTPHVREILALVGLDCILESQITGRFPYFSTRFEETAA